MTNARNSRMRTCCVFYLLGGVPQFLTHSLAYIILVVKNIGCVTCLLDAQPILHDLLGTQVVTDVKLVGLQTVGNKKLSFASDYEWQRASCQVIIRLGSSNWRKCSLH